MAKKEVWRIVKDIEIQREVVDEPDDQMADVSAPEAAPKAKIRSGGPRWDKWDEYFDKT